MRKELIDLVEGRLRDTKTVLTSNAKGPTGMPYPTRSIYILAEKYIREHLRKKDTPSPRWLVVPGLRGVGKSTLLAQLYVAFSNNSNVIPLYFAMDDVVNLLKSNLQEVLEVYQQLTGTNLATVQKTVLIFLDEVHYDPSWSSVLKVIYDKNPNIFIFCTGSSAIALQANTDAIRRISIERLYPMSFAEFIFICKKKYPVGGLKDKLKMLLWESKSATDMYSRLKHLESSVDEWWKGVTKQDLDYYLLVGAMPFATIYDDQAKALQAIHATIEKIVKIDIPQLKDFENKTLNSIFNILWLLANSGDLSLRGISDATGLQVPTVIDVLDTLQKTELLIRIQPHATSMEKQLPNSKSTKPSKYLFMSPAMRAAVLSSGGGMTLIEKKKGYLLEDAVGLYFYKEFINRNFGSVMYFRDDTEQSADFLVERGGRRIPVEVGLGTKECSQVLNVLQKYPDCPYGIVIDDGHLDLVEQKVVKIPLKFFLLA
jgi:predicted AAA+ superfamily ATPase